MKYTYIVQKHGKKWAVGYKELGTDTLHDVSFHDTKKAAEVWAAKKNGYTYAVRTVRIMGYDFFVEDVVIK